MGPFYEAALSSFQTYLATGEMGEDPMVIARVEEVERENAALKKDVATILARLAALESKLGGDDPKSTSCGAADDEADDDDVDLFASDEEEDAEAERIKAERVAAYNARKAAKEEKKGKLIAKSNILLDVKPWDDETPLSDMEKAVRSIEMDGLLWGSSKFVAVGYGIKKLQIMCVVEDDKVGTDDLEDKITAFEDFVQSVDIAAFNKI